jgi:hypothetical protein
VIFPQTFYIKMIKQKSISKKQKPCFFFFIKQVKKKEPSDFFFISTFREKNVARP